MAVRAHVRRCVLWGVHFLKKEAEVVEDLEGTCIVRRSREEIKSGKAQNYVEIK